MFMKKYEEEHYLYENIKEKIYPWVSSGEKEPNALNGKRISEKDTPMIQFVGDLRILFVIKRGEEAYEIIKDHMLPQDCDIESLYHQACENLVRDVEFNIGNTMYGAFAILADGYHEASSLCFQHIWNVCAEKLEDDLVIMAPLKDTVLFAPASSEQAVETMKKHAEQAYTMKPYKVSTKSYLFSRKEKELLILNDDESSLN